ncbi:GNAT family N-acetyltransferase [Herbidospora cretacea]|uniref:GNAT family N-acetyltransferase n=1 Tax=Herbidospora cretacea TaxID=28444 RepID=UPI000A80514F|nr:GNAT family N-acetyltransferase [Herbidospora cretacea]
MGPPDIRQATEADLPALIETLQQTAYFADRLHRQAAGHGLLLVAWEGDRPVGDVYLWMGAAEEAALRRHLPDVALITHLEVVAHRRGNGIGTRLLAEAERRLWFAGRKKVALGVDLGNHRAEKLYAREGYKRWEYGLVETVGIFYRPDGSPEQRPELCRIMVKELRA